VSGHTPGPWTYYRNGDQSQVDCTTGTICQSIAWAPNGPLIAAAPDLLAALKGVAWGDRPCWCGYVVGDTHTWHCREARAAIAKAEGREP